MCCCAFSLVFVCNDYNSSNRQIRTHEQNHDWCRDYRRKDLNVCWWKAGRALTHVSLSKVGSKYSKLISNGALGRLIRDLPYWTRRHTYGPAKNRTEYRPAVFTVLYCISHQHARRSSTVLILLRLQWISKQDQIWGGEVYWLDGVRRQIPGTDQYKAMSKPRRTINANGDVVLVGGSGSGNATSNGNGAGEMLQQQQQQQSSESPFGSLTSSFNNFDWNQLPMMNRMLLGFGAMVFFLMFGRLLFPICMLLMMASYLSRNGSSLSGSGSGLSYSLLTSSCC